MDYAKLIRASLDLERELAERAARLMDLRATAASYAEAGNHSVAERTYHELLAFVSDDAGIWRELGYLYIKAERLLTACEALVRSLSLDINQPRVHLDIGAAVRQINPCPPSLQDYCALFDDAACAGTAETTCDDAFAVIEDRLRLACMHEPNAADLRITLGHICMARGDVEGALQAYSTASDVRAGDAASAEILAEALRVHGSHARAAALLAQAYYRERRFSDAIPHYRDAIAWQEDGTGVMHAELAHALNHEKQYAAAIDACAEALLRKPELPEYYAEWAYALSEMNRSDEALAVAAQATAQFPQHTALAHLAALMLPVVYHTAQEIEEWRQRFSEGMGRICREARLADAASAQNALKAISPPFYLAYQGRNDRDLMRQYGDLTCRVMRANHPAYAVPRKMPALPADGRIRVGYVSASLRWSGVGEIFLDWLARRDAERFETFVYNAGRAPNLVARQFELASDHYRWLPRDAAAAAEQVLADDLHILVYLEIGMHPFMTQLAALRLAPIQCAAAGHPVTTGLPTVDYFLSSEYAEPADGQDHYTEQLIRLPNIGICPRRPYPPAQGLTRAQLGIDEQAVAYFSPQSVTKYLPQYDDLYPAIAQRVPNAQFIFMPRAAPECVEAFRARLHHAFARRGLDGARHIRILPATEYLEYLGMHRSMDIFLDTIGWSGGLSTLDALGCGLPVVTLPGALMRGRQSQAYLRLLGITETIATTESEYVNMAVRLGLDSAWRQDMRSRITERSDNLYDSAERTRGLERFYQRAVQEWLQKEA